MVRAVRCSLCGSENMFVNKDPLKRKVFDLRTGVSLNIKSYSVLENNSRIVEKFTVKLCKECGEKYLEWMSKVSLEAVKNLGETK